MNALARLLDLSIQEKTERGLMYTPAEIAQQPASWESTFSLFQKERTGLTEFLRNAGLGDAGPKPTVFLIGAGTSDYIGRSLVSVLRRLWKCPVFAIPSTTLLTHGDEYIIPNETYIWISFSRSGDSPEGVSVLEKALSAHPEIHHVVITCNAKGRMIDCAAGKKQVATVVLNEAVNDLGLAMTSSFSNMVVFGQCLAHIHDIAKYEPILGGLVEAGESFLPLAADAAESLAAESYAKMCFLGSGALEGVAAESRLKVLEMTAGRILTMSESFLGLRHGPMAALDESTLLVAFLSSDEKVARYEIDLLREVAQKRLVKTQVVVGGNSKVPVDGFTDHYLSPVLSPEVRTAVRDDCRPPVDVMFGQLLGLFCSLHWKLRPDRPSPDGVISRVVEGVTVYG